MWRTFGFSSQQLCALVNFPSFLEAPACSGHYFQSREEGAATDTHAPCVSGASIRSSPSIDKVPEGIMCVSKSVPVGGGVRAGADAIYNVAAIAGGFFVLGDKACTNGAPFRPATARKPNPFLKSCSPQRTQPAAKEQRSTIKVKRSSLGSSMHTPLPLTGTLAVPVQANKLEIATGGPDAELAALRYPKWWCRKGRIATQCSNRPPC